MPTAARRRSFPTRPGRRLLCRAWRPGQYKRWYLRALQEEFDARLYPYGWTHAGVRAGRRTGCRRCRWPARPTNPPCRPRYYEYMLDVGGGPADTELRPRSIPLHARDTRARARRLSESLWLEWLRPPQEYFEFRTPEAFKVDPRAVRRRETGARRCGRWSWTARAARC